MGLFAASKLALSRPEGIPPSLSRIFPFSCLLLSPPRLHPHCLSVVLPHPEVQAQLQRWLTPSSHWVDTTQTMNSGKEMSLFSKKSLLCLPIKWLTRLKKRGFGKMPFITKGAQWSTLLSPGNSMMVSQFQKIVWVTSGGSGGKEAACNARGLGSILGLGRSLGEGNGYPLHYSSLGNSMDRGDWKATVHEVAKMQTRLRD